MDKTFAYAEIVKTEKQADGTLMVYGKATDDALDIDKQICDAAWLNKAMPEWFKSGGNIREQHMNIAAGVATEYDATVDGHYITAHVVDSGSVKKVEAKVLKGFSIGIHGPRIIRDEKAANGRIVDGTIVEVSLVDRPANPNAVLMLAKTVDGELAQVEDFTETPLVEPLVSLSKSFLAELVKFDQASYDAARRALTDLIVVEANEMGDTGSDERDSIEALLDAVKHLFEWYESEVAEGEAPPLPDSDMDAQAILLDAEPELVKEAEAVVEAEPEVAEPEVVVEPEPADKALQVSDDVVADIVAKAVLSATEAVKSEIDSLKAAQVAAEDESARLQVELSAALSKAAAGGPKRTSTNSPSRVSEFVSKAQEFRAKAATATDSTLARGYRELADDLEAKATKTTHLSEQEQ